MFPKRLISAFLAMVLVVPMTPLTHAQALVNTQIGAFTTATNVRTNLSNDPLLAKPGDDLSFLVTMDNTGDVPADNVRFDIAYTSSNGNIAMTGEGITVPNNEGQVLNTGDFVVNTVDIENTVNVGVVNHGQSAKVNYTLTLDSSFNTPVFEHNTVFTSDNANTVESNHPIIVDVRPHVLSAEFTPESIPGNGVATTILTLEVADNNGCTDIASVTADLTPLFPGEDVAETPLDFVSCDTSGDVEVATYQKTDIQYNGAANDFVIPVVAIDSAGNRSDTVEEYFGDNDLYEARLSIVENKSPAVTATSNVSVVDGASVTQVEITWQADKAVDYYLRRSQDPSGSELVCDDISDGEMIHNMIGNALNQNLDNTFQAPDTERTQVAANTPITSVIQADSFDREGIWYVRVCTSYFDAVDNLSYTAGSTVQIEKVSSEGALIVEHQGNGNTISDVAGDVEQVRWYVAGEIQDGNYTVTINGDVNPPVAVAPVPDPINVSGAYVGVPITTIIDESFFNLGANSVLIDFTDSLGKNLQYTYTVTKVTAPNPVASVTFLADTDVTAGLDIRDIDATWSAFPTADNFQNYNVYIVPDSLGVLQSDFQDGTLSHIYTTTQREDNPSGSGVRTLNGNNAPEPYVAADSQGNRLMSGIAYRLYVQVENQNDVRSLAVASNETQMLTLDGAPDFLRAQYIDLGDASAVPPRPGQVRVEFTDTLDPAFVDLTKISGGFVNPRNPVISDSVLIFEIDPIVAATPEQAASPMDLISIDAGAVRNNEGDQNLARLNQLLGDGIAPQVTLSAPVANSFVGENLQIIYTFNEAVQGNQTNIRIEQVGGTADANAPYAYPLSEANNAGNTEYTVVLNTRDLSGNGDVTQTDRLVVNGQYRLVMTFTDANGNSSTATVEPFTVDRNDGGPDSEMTPAFPLPVNNTGFTTFATPSFQWQEAQDNPGGSGISNYTLEIAEAGNNDPFQQIQQITGTGQIISYLLPGNLALPQEGNYQFRIIAFDFAGNSVTSDWEAFTYETDAPVVSNISLVNNSNPGLPAKNGVDVRFQNGDTYTLTATITDTANTLDVTHITANLNVLDTALTDSENPATLDANGLATWTGTINQSNGVVDISVEAAFDPALVGQSQVLRAEIDSTFPIIAADALSVLNNPVAGNRPIFKQGDSMQIRWDTAKISEANYANNPIDLLLINPNNGNATVATIANNQLNNGAFNWTVPGGINLNGLAVRIIVRDVFGNSSSADIAPSANGFTLTIDNENPTDTPSIDNGTLPTAIRGGDPLTFNWGTTYADALSAQPALEQQFVIVALIDDGVNPVQEVPVTTATNPTDTFVWTTPSSVDGDVVLQITSRDLAGNEVTNTSNAFHIDTIAPSITGARTLDNDGNGSIDHIELTYSEAVQDGTLNSTLYAVTGFTVNGIVQLAGDGNNDAIVTLELVESGSFDTGATPTITYTASPGATQDLLGLQATTQGGIVSVDTASPIVISSAIADADNNGYVDGISIQFSENMDLTGNITDATFTNMPSGATILSHIFNNDTVSILLTEGAAAPDTSLGNLEIALPAASSVQDLAGNSAVAVTLDNTRITDNAAPVFFVYAIDTSVTAVDQTPGVLTLSFTEDITQNTVDVADFNFSNGYTGNTLVFDQANLATITLNENYTSTDSSTLPAVTYTGAANLTDGNANELIGNSPLNTADALTPKVQSITIQDTDGNGSVDQAIITLSENIDDTSLVNNAFSVNGSPSITTTALNNVITASFSQEVPGTADNIADITFNTGAFSDLVGNSTLPLGASDIDEIDEAGPALVGAVYIEATREYTVTFSEAIDDSSVSLGTTGVFTLAGGGTLTNATINFGADAANNEVLIIELGAADTDPTLQTSTLSLAAADVVFDSALPTANGNLGTIPVPVLGSLIINEVNWGEAGEEWIELRNLSDTPIDFSVTPHSIYRSNVRIAEINNGVILGNTTNPYFIVADQAVTSNELRDSSFTEGVNYLTVTSLNLAPVANLELTLYEGATSAGTQLDRVDDGADNTYFAGTDVISGAGTVASMERRVIVGAGNLPSSWQTSTTIFSNFDTPVATRRGTPGAENADDIATPVILDGIQNPSDTRTPSANTLTINRSPEISVSYQDNPGGSGIDISAVEISVNGVDVSAQATIGATNLSYTPAAVLPFGENTVEVTVYDNAGNPSPTSTWSFWIDNPQVDIINPGVLFSLQSGTAATSDELSETAIVAVSTYGAGINLLGEIDQLLSSTTDQIADYTNLPEDGFGYEVVVISQPATDPAPTLGAIGFTDTFSGFGAVASQTVLNGATVAPAGLVPGASELQTHYFIIQYRLAVSNTQTPDIYTNLIQYVPQFNY